MKILFLHGWTTGMGRTMLLSGDAVDHGLERLGLESCSRNSQAGPNYTGQPAVDSYHVTGIEEFHEEITSKNYKYNRPGLETTFYDAKCVEVIDPFGNRIRFNERIEKGET